MTPTTPKNVVNPVSTTSAPKPKHVSLFETRADKLRREEMRKRDGRRCIMCSARLSRYNPAETCNVCDGGLDLTRTTKPGPKPGKRG